MTAARSAAAAPANSCRPRVAYQGVAGAFGEDAILQLWRGRADGHPARTFAAALDAVRDGVAGRAVIPVWNSTVGSIEPACAALADCGRTVAHRRAVDVPVRHCLLALPGTAIDDVRWVGSHPAALAQCGRLFRARPHLTPCDAFDTAGAALELSRLVSGAPPDVLADVPWYDQLSTLGDRSRLAVIASAGAARRYGLAVLRHDVQDEPGNATRFVVVARAREALPC